MRPRAGIERKGILAAVLALGLMAGIAPRGWCESRASLLASAKERLASNDDARGAMADLDLALAAPDAAGAEAHDIALLRIGLLIRTGRAEEALASLAAPPPKGIASDILDPEYRPLRAKAFYKLGRRREAVAELRAGVERFPSDPRLARLFFERSSVDNPSAQERELGDLFVKRLPALVDSDPELRILALPFMLDRRSREDSLAAYRALGLASPRSVLLSLEYGLVSDEEAIAEFFTLPSPLPRDELKKLYRLLRSDEGRGAFRAALAAFGGRLSVDSDSDGFPETITAYEKGMPTEWKRDADQDGWPEYSLSFSEGRPRTARIELGEVDTLVVWSDYPYLESLASGGLLYRFGPGTLSWKPLVYEGLSDPADGPLFLVEESDRPGAGVASGDALPSERAAASAALAVERHEGDFLEVTSLDHGRTLRRESFIGGQPVAIMSFERGFPVRELADTDGDGYFETERLWNLSSSSPLSAFGEEPPPATIRLDSDKDGIFEYREDSAFPFLKEWDLDHDGLMDVRQRELAGGGRRLDFSSRLDGSFDEQIELDAAGKAISVTRDGRKSVLVADANHALWWIGRKPFDLGESLPATDGLFELKGIRYRLVWAGSEAYAEALP